MLDDLVGPNVKLARATGGASAAWLPEVGAGADSDPAFDSITLIPKRIQGSTVVSRQLVAQSSPDIEAFVASSIADAIVVAVDNAAINGTGTGAQPLGILNVAPNASGSYNYANRSADVTFGGAATWASVLAFEKNLELGLIENDGTFGYVVDPATRDKWQQAQKVSGYPVFLWENTDDDDTFGRVNGRKAISTTQLSGGRVIFGKWSELILASWLGVEILVDQYSLAVSGEIRIRVSLFADIGFRYSLAFCASSDSGAQ
jgi:HK97 family phage major capsid protein